MSVPALLADRIEFVKKKNSGPRSDVIEKPSPTPSGLAEIAARQALVEYDN